MPIRGKRMLTTSLGGTQIRLLPELAAASPGGLQPFFFKSVNLCSRMRVTMPAKVPVCRIKAWGERKKIIRRKQARKRQKYGRVSAESYRNVRSAPTFPTHGIRRTNINRQTPVANSINLTRLGIITVRSGIQRISSRRRSRLR